MTSTYTNEFGGGKLLKSFLGRPWLRTYQVSVNMSILAANEKQLWCGSGEDACPCVGVPSVSPRMVGGHKSLPHEHRDTRAAGPELVPASSAFLLQAIKGQARFCCKACLRSFLMVSTIVSRDTGQGIIPQWHQEQRI